jgi:hypothetical protein
MIDVILVALGTIPYFITTLYHTIQACRRGNRDKFKEWFGWCLLSLTVVVPIFATLIFAVGGFVAALTWFFTDWLPNKLFNRFTK